jgi:hypothetical protein
LALACKSAVLINLADGDLDRGVILGLDDTVGRAAFAGNVAVKRLNISILKGILGVALALSGGAYRSTSSPLSFSMFAMFLAVRI